jgi:hypothetical protein
LGRIPHEEPYSRQKAYGKKNVIISASAAHYGLNDFTKRLNVKNYVELYDVNSYLLVIILVSLFYNF